MMRLRFCKFHEFQYAIKEELGIEDVYPLLTYLLLSPFQYMLLRPCYAMEKPQKSVSSEKKIGGS